MPPDQLKKIRAKALEHNRTIAGKVPPVPMTVPQSSLKDVLADPNATWKFSGEGSGGASLMTSPNVSSGGAAIKIEHGAQVTSGMKGAKLMDAFFNNAQGESPFSAPRVTSYTPSDLQNDPTLATGMKSKLDQLALTTPQSRQEKVTKHKQGVDDMVAGKEVGIAIMEYGSGVQLNKLSTQDKAALVRSEAFAESIGRAMAPSIALGMRDHLGTHAANPSNVMYDQATGRMTLIDYDTGSPYELKKQGPGVYKYGVYANATSNTQEMRTFLEDALKSPKDFEKALDQIVDPNGLTPFSPVMRNFTGSSNTGDYFFNSKESDTYNAFTKEERRDFAAHLLKGAVQGMAYMQGNQQALEDAVKTTYDKAPDGTAIENFYSAKQMQEYRAEINKVNVDSMSRKMDKMLAHREHALEKQVKEHQKLTEKLATTDKSIDRITHRPTPGDKIKAFFSRKGHEPIDDLTSKRREITAKLATLEDAVEKADFQQRMRTGKLADKGVGVDEGSEVSTSQEETVSDHGKNLKSSLGTSQSESESSKQEIGEDESVDDLGPKVPIPNATTVSSSLNNSNGVQVPTQGLSQSQNQSPPRPGIQAPDMGPFKKSPFEEADDHSSSVVVSDDSTGTSLSEEEAPSMDDLRQSPFEDTSDVGVSKGKEKELSMDELRKSPFEGVESTTQEVSQEKTKKVGDMLRSSSKREKSTDSLSISEKDGTKEKVGQVVKGPGSNNESPSNRSSRKISS